MAFLTLPKKIGRPVLYTPESLWEKFVEYYEYSHNNPIEVDQYFNSKEKVRRVKVQKQRAITIAGFCIFAGFSRQAWYDYKTIDEYKDTMTMIQDVMFDHKFQGAAVGIFDANIIARELGLADRRELNGNVGIGITVKDLTDDDIETDQNSLSDNN